ncbi:ATP-binding protein [Pseudomonas sp. SZMC_28357]|uniref:ATP-dependent nuclease n=1 Tax=Pseudomonas sp. SZMC_28357 TaxID=3074380 RepID=UPI002870DFC6|nr:ATP-binding protein [Pseudomonas sp. SZMC_28357]MDR9753569.1 ATP-binding protein [Pseudomonas sp. SZMC_28357]
MKITRIWFSGIRALNTPEKKSSCSGWMDLPTALTQSKPIEPGEINILIGENGGGKSTVIDMIRAVAFPEVLASLPRENPPNGTPPAFEIEFEGGDRLVYRFCAPLDDELDGAEYVGCYQFWRNGNESAYLNEGDLYKHAPNSPIPRFFTFENIKYRNGSHPEDMFDTKFVDELNAIREHLQGLAIKPRGPMAKDLLNRSSLQAAENGLLNVWLDDDHKMSNQLHGQWLPSGWKNFAAIVAWLRTCPNESICLIEEPEIHLHPTLIRYLMNSLINIARTEKNQQLFISTHSAALINIATKDKLKIFQSYGTYIDCKPDLGAVLDRMGYMASDILQANCVIWVEGPSDRYYLNHWIKGIAPELLEGTHYSVMFYGGRLLSHLTAEDDDDHNLSDLISLTTLNRHSAILLDSDKDSPYKRINTTKKRIISEFSSSKERYAWVTKGREVENYLNMDKLEAIIKEVHPSAAKIAEKSTWSNLLEYKKPRARKIKTANKVKVATHYVASHAQDYSVLDLKLRIQELCEFIRRWNPGHTPNAVVVPVDPIADNVYPALSAQRV